jgi:hypothetical protein
MRVMVFDVSDPADSPKGRGRLKFKAMPRCGEWIDVEEDNQSHMFEVLMIVHSSVFGGSDVYVRRVGESVDVRSGLHGMKWPVHPSA